MFYSSSDVKHYTHELKNLWLRRKGTEKDEEVPTAG